GVGVVDLEERRRDVVVPLVATLILRVDLRGLDEPEVELAEGRRGPDLHELVPDEVSFDALPRIDDERLHVGLEGGDPGGRDFHRLASLPFAGFSGVVAVPPAVAVASVLVPLAAGGAGALPVDGASGAGARSLTTGSSGYFRLCSSRASVATESRAAGPR